MAFLSSLIGVVTVAVVVMAVTAGVAGVLWRSRLRRFQAMAEILGRTTDGVFEVDRNWRLRYMNDRARVMLGTGHCLTGKCLWDAVPEAVGTVFGRQYRRAMEQQEPVEFEGFFPPLDAWFAVRAFPSPNGLSVFFQDITARKTRLTSLEAENRSGTDLLALLNALLEHAPVGFAFFDGTHRLIRANGVMAAMVGRPAAELVGHSLAEVMPAQAPALEPLLAQVLSTGVAVLNHEIVSEAPDDSPASRYWETGFYPVTLNGKIIAVGGVMMEVSELRDAEAGRRRSDERFRAVFEQASVGMQRIGLDGTVLDANGAFCTILGRRRDEVVGHSFLKHVAPDAAAAETLLVERLLAGDRASYTIERAEQRPDGSRVWLRISSSLARITGGEPAYRIAVIEDVTEAKRLEAELRSASEAAESANLAKTKFLAAASHDLRQPMQSLFFFTAALANQIDAPRAQETVRHLQRGLDALKGLLDSLLDVSRLDANLTVTREEEFPVTDLVELVAASYRPAVEAKGLVWHADACAVTVRSDRTLLLRMISNLMDNALRYTAKGEVRLECRVSPRAVQIVVQDTGIGIPAEHMERIFEEFQQLDTPGRDRDKGLGLGLAIVRRLSRLLKHPVEVRSSPGKGSEFAITVPRGQSGQRSRGEPVRAAAGALAALAETPGKGGGRGRCVLLVDDDAIVLMGLEAVLGDWGYTVVTACSADQALERLNGQGRRPDIVISDYQLRHNRVGTEVVLRVRERFGADIPGVILTGETGAACANDASALGLTVVVKPVTPRQLAAALDAHLVPTA